MLAFDTRWVRIFSESACQYTGRKLLNPGKPNAKLYRGDIIQCWSGLDDEQIKRNGVVIWDNDESAWSVNFKKENVVLLLAQVMSNYNSRIITNIHGGPKLFCDELKNSDISEEYKRSIEAEFAK